MSESLKNKKSKAYLHLHYTKTFFFVDEYYTQRNYPIVVERSQTLVVTIKIFNTHSSSQSFYPQQWALKLLLLGLSPSMPQLLMGLLENDSITICHGDLCISPTKQLKNTFEKIAMAAPSSH